MPDLIVWLVALAAAGLFLCLVGFMAFRMYELHRDMNTLAMQHLAAATLLGEMTASLKHMHFVMDQHDQFIAFMQHDVEESPHGLH